MLAVWIMNLHTAGIKEEKRLIDACFPQLSQSTFATNLERLKQWLEKHPDRKPLRIAADEHEQAIAVWIMNCHARGDKREMKLIDACLPQMQGKVKNTFEMNLERLKQWIENNPDQKLSRTAADEHEHAMATWIVNCRAINQNWGN